MKTNTKLQTSNTTKLSNINLQKPLFMRLFFGVWNLVFCWCLMFGVWCFAEPASTPKLPSKEKLHLYLLLGQSNMAGRGDLAEEDKTPHPRILVFRTNQVWEVAVEPIHTDRPGVKFGVGPGFAFGKIMADKSPEATIGLVPCAVGGTSLSRWVRGGDLYSNAVFRAKLTMTNGTLKGILWHQGENDAGSEHNAKTYGERLQKMIADIREDLGTPDLPFVVGEIGEFLYTRKDPTKTPFAKIVNEALIAIPEKVPNTACARSAGLNHKGDEVHFDAASQREFGQRYAAEMLRLQKKISK